MVGLPATTMRSPDLPVPREGQQARCFGKPAIEEAAPGSGYSLPLTGLPLICPSHNRGATMERGSERGNLGAPSENG